MWLRQEMALTRSVLQRWRYTTLILQPYKDECWVHHWYQG